MKKNTTWTICGLTLLSLALYAPSALAQDVQQEKTTTTTTTKTFSSGTVSTMSPESIVIRTSGAAAPITYEFTETTTYVDEAGNPVKVETVKTGVPVTIYYSQDGDKMVATKVVVKKTVSPPKG